MGGRWAWQPQLTVSVHAHDEVVAHGPCLAQLVRVAIMHHVIAVERAGVSPWAARGHSLARLRLKPSEKQPLGTAPQVGLGLGFQRGGGT